MNLGIVKFARPESPFLQKYIKGYYMHRSEDPNFSMTVYFYQNVTSFIDICRDTQITSHPHEWRYQAAPDTGFKSRLVAKIPGHQKATFQGKFDKVTIVFYSLGLNHFIRQPLSKLVTGIYSPFTHLDEQYSGLLPRLFEAPTIFQKRDLLDAFFLSQFQIFPEPRLIKAVKKLIQQKTPLKVAELANSLGIHRRTLLRLFQKHLTYSIEEYQAVIKFRRALIQFQQQGKSNLTNIAYGSGYYDQSDFNHQFKSRSGLTPSELFSQLNIIDNTLFWNAK